MNDRKADIQDIGAAVAGVDESGKCAWRSNEGALFKQGTIPSGQQLDCLRGIVAHAKP